MVNQSGAECMSVLAPWPPLIAERATWYRLPMKSDAATPQLASQASNAARCARASEPPCHGIDLQDRRIILRVRQHRCISSHSKTVGQTGR